MKRQKTYLVGIFIAFCFMFVGCASVPTASVEKDLKAKNFISNPNKAIIYIYRDEYFGGLFEMEIALDGKHLGKTGPKTFFRVEVDAGEHYITSIAFNNYDFVLHTKIGEIYFVRQEVQVGSVKKPRAILYSVSSNEGKEAVNSCKLIAITGETS